MKEYFLVAYMLLLGVATSMLIGFISHDAAIICFCVLYIFVFKLRIKEKKMQLKEQKQAEKAHKKWLEGIKDTKRYEK